MSPGPAGRVQPRDDLRSLDGYHSPQVDVRVRLNTNESPFGPSPKAIEAIRTTAADSHLNESARLLIAVNRAD